MFEVSELDFNSDNIFRVFQVTIQVSDVSCELFSCEEAQMPLCGRFQEGTDHIEKGNQDCQQFRQRLEL